MGPLRRARRKIVVFSRFMEDRGVRGDLQRSTLSVENHTRRGRGGMAAAIALPRHQPDNLFDSGPELMVC
jgi:hypothetical protein